MALKALARYFDKRDFKITSEPQSGTPSPGALTFVIQKHAASRLHYDFRLELDGTLKSWAVPKGPSLDPADKRMAVHVEDHPIDYGRFEGEIPPGQYGAGHVIVWDRGTWEPVGDPQAGYRDGKLKFRLHGEKLEGGWALVRMHGHANERQEPWLLIKEKDDAARPSAEYSVVDAEPDSVLSDYALPEKAVKVAAKRAAPAAAKKGSGATRVVAPTKVVAAEKVVAAKKAATPKARTTAAKKTALPDSLSPQLATLVSAAPKDAGWIWEIKFDGYRILARVDDGDVKLFTRRGNDWTSRLPELAKAIGALGIGSGWLDGEIVVNGAHGAPDFNALQNAFDSSRTGSILYCAFDLPFHDGADLRALPLSERRARLATLLEHAPAERIRFSENFDAAPEELLQNACRMRLEGMIGKRADSPYVEARSKTWIKLKCTQRQEFVIGGWTDPKGSRTGVGSLLLGIHDERGHLRFAGAVGSGFDEKTLARLRAALEEVASDEAPFFEKARDVKGHWVKPTLVAEVSFGEWTPEGRIRHSVFHGLREDKPAKAITREQPSLLPLPPAGEGRGEGAPPAKKATPKRPATDTEVEGIRISHPERVIDASTGLTKLDLVNHYLHVAKLILPHLHDRPVSLVRAPAGIEGHLFFQKHAEALKIPELKRLDPKISPDHKPMIEVDSFAALIGAAQNNVVEFHTWNATSGNSTRPDRMIFDLDPGEGVGWKQIQEATELTRSLLDQLGLQSFLKTSGGKGLHVVVPLAPKDGWDEVKALSKAIVEHMATVIPDRFVAKSGPKNRVGRIFVDYLRNGFGATTACAWSARSRPGLGVSVPCAWDELGALTGGAHWTVANLGERLEEHVDPWRGYATAKQSLVKAKKLLLGD